MKKRWSKTEITHLKKNAPTQSVEELAERFHTDADTVRSKLTALKITSNDRHDAETDAALAHFEDALKAVHEKKWEAATKLLQTVVEQADNPQLSDRARQYLEICLRQQEELSSEDPYLLAVFEKNRGNLETALDICRQHNDKKVEKFTYLMASIHALAEQEDEALESLAASIDLEPKNRVHAYHDPDFKGMQGNEAFNELVAVS